MPSQIAVGFLLFPDVTPLDLIGPYEVFASLPQARIHLLWKDLAPIQAALGPRPGGAAGGLTLHPTTAFADAPKLDVLCIPGGPGVNPLMVDDEVLDFVRRQADTARYVTSVCAGALVLGAAGLLKGRRANTHWMSQRFLPAFGAIPVDERVVFDGPIVTGGGVTAGIDFGLALVAALLGDETAQMVQLGIEYAPAPPFAAGSPETAPPSILQALTMAAAPMIDGRTRVVAQAAQALETGAPGL